MVAALGIDLGTEFCRLVIGDHEGRLHPVASQQAQVYKTPCAIGYDQGWVWGWSATGESQNVTWDLRSQLTQGLRREFADIAYEADDLVTEFFRRLHWGLQELPNPARGGRTVLAVPYTLGFRQRRQLRDAIANAGFAVTALINDAEAAVLGFEMEATLLDYDERPARVLLFDVGADHTALSLLEISLDDGQLVIDLIMHDNEAPGLRSVQQAVLQQAGYAMRDNRPPALVAEWFNGLLVQASIQNEDVTMDLEGRTWTLDAKTVSGALQTWRMKVDAGLKRVFRGAGIQPQDIDIALPCGGGCELPEVRQTVAHFPTILEPPTGTRYESLIAAGAARYAYLLGDPSRSPRLVSGQTPALGLELADGSFHPLLAVNHADGTSDFRVYALPADGASAMCLKPLQGFARCAPGNLPLAAEPISVPLTEGGPLVKVEASRAGDEQVTFVVTHDTDRREVSLDLR
jgi:molecular chaperone DnaK (HSP70)